MLMRSMVSTSTAAMAQAMAHDGGTGPGALVGTVARLAVDAWRVRGALEQAARGGRVVEDLDAVA